MIESFTTERGNTKSWFYKLTKEKFFAALLKEVSMSCKNAVSTELLSKNLWVNSLTFDTKTTLMKEIQSVITEKYDFEYRDKSLIKVPFYFSDLQKLGPGIKRKKLPFCSTKQNFSIETTTKKNKSINLVMYEFEFRKRLINNSTLRFFEPSSFWWNG